MLRCTPTEIRGNCRVKAMAWPNAEPFASSDVLVKMPSRCATIIPRLMLSAKPKSSAFTISRFIAWLVVDVQSVSPAGPRICKWSAVFKKSLGPDSRPCACSSINQKFPGCGQRRQVPWEWRVSPSNRQSAPSDENTSELQELGIKVRHHPADDAIVTLWKRS